jgi:hypothetical protein
MKQMSVIEMLDWNRIRKVKSVERTVKMFECVDMIFPGLKLAWGFF